MKENKKNEKVLHYIIYTLIIISVLALYNETYKFDFINYDDDDYVTENVFVSNGITLNGLKWAFTSKLHEHWHPLTWISHMIDCHVFGLNPKWHHFVNVALHAASAAILFAIFNTLTGHLWKSIAVAVLFAIHPLNIQSVAWIAERKNVLSTFLAFVSVYSYILYAQSKRLSKYILSLLFFILALLSKSMVVTIPAVMLILDCWPLGRINTASHSEKFYSFFNKNKLLILEKIPFFIASASISIAIILIHDVRKESDFFVAKQLSERILDVFSAYIIYIEKIFFPINLSIIYPNISSTPLLFQLASLLVVSAITVIFFIYRKKYTFFLCGWTWYIITLFPVTGIVQTGPQVIADRFVYIPSIGIFVILVWGVDYVYNFVKLKFIYRITISILAFCFISYITFNNIKNWKNSEEIFSQALKNTQNNMQAHVNYALIFTDKDTGKALHHLLKAQEIDKRNPSILYSIGTINMNLKKYDTAIEYFERALEIYPKYADAHNNLGNIYLNKKNLDLAISNYEAAIKIDPNHYKAIYNVGLIYQQKNDFIKATEFFERALEINPNHKQIQDSLRKLNKQ